MASIRGNGWFVHKNGKIYLCGTSKTRIINGRKVKGTFVRESTHEDYTPALGKWYEEHAREEIEKIANPTRFGAVDIESFGKTALELTAHKRNKNTQKVHLSNLKRHIAPRFRNYALENILPMDIIFWQKELLKKYSSSTVSNITVTLSIIMEQAFFNDIIEKNPMERVEAIEVTFKKSVDFTIAERDSLLFASRGVMKPFTYLAFFTGLRASELIGLKVGDFYLEEEVLHLQRSITSGREVGSNRTKNHDRYIPLPRPLLSVLKEYFATLPAQQEYLFVNKDGGHYFDIGPLTRKFKKLCVSIGIEDKTLKNARNTYINMLDTKRADAETIKEIAGHSKNSNVTQKHYVTRGIERAKHQIEEINNVFSAPIKREELDS